MTTYMYVSISGEDRIALFEVDPDTGRLDHRGDVAVSGGPAPLATDPQRGSLYVGRRGSNQISSFRIDPGTGGLSATGTVDLESDPCYLATDRTGRYLLSAYYGAGGAAVHPIDGSGAVGGARVEWRATAMGAHCIQTDPSNRFVLLPHIAGEVGTNLIYLFRFDETTGRLTPSSPPTLTPDKDAGPRHYCFHPTRDVVYFSNEHGSSVTAYDFGPETGTLAPFHTVSTLPGDYDGENTCSQIQITPSGRFLYAPNRGHNSIAVFSVDQDNGRLTPVERVAADAVPRAIGLDPEGRYFYATGLHTGRLTSFRIDPDTGELTPLETIDVGASPMWVLTMSLGG
jgi:6-phosphogluconolactonase